MGQHPSTTVEFIFPNNLSKKEIHQALKRAIDNNKLYEFETLEPEKFMTALYSSPTWGWIDMVHFSLRENSNSIIVTGYSRSTNFCPSSFGCAQSIFSCFGAYNDKGSNCQHIFEIVDNLQTLTGKSLKYTKKRLIAKTGRSKTYNYSFDTESSSDDEQSSIYI